MKTILVPTDFSAPARRALEYAVALAAHTQSRIVLFHAFHRPINIWQAAEVFDKINEFEETEKARLESLAREVKQAEPVLAGAGFQGSADKAPMEEPFDLAFSKAAPGGEVEITCQARFGLVEDEIIKASQTHQADLIVMGMRGANALSEIFLGSTTTGVMRNAPCALLAIPEKTVFQPIRKILFATDFKGLPDASQVNVLLDFKTAFGASLCLVHLYGKKDDEDFSRSAAADEIEYYFRKHDYTLYFVQREDVLEGIQEQIEKLDPQLLALVPRKHDLIDRLLGYSISQKLAFHAPIPLLALPTAEKKPKAEV
jgi:nucleotide-binding universal stress UspA family protein